MSFGRIARGVRTGALATATALVPLLGAAQASAQDDGLAARVWLDRGEEPLLEQGDAVRLYYRASLDAFVAIFHIDTNGGVRLVFPRSPDENHYVRGGRDYRLLFPRSPYWRVDDDPGVGYFFILASPEPFDFNALPYSHYGRGWDLSRVGRQLYQDPYVAMDDWVATLIPDWEYVPYALDFITYHVGERYEYPRFLCYDCHGFRPFYAWNPYHYSCTDFRVVIVDDPYYYPVSRYRGSQVVYARPPDPFQPRFAFKERAQGEPSTPVLAPRNAVPRRGSAVDGPRRPAGVQDGRGSPATGEGAVWPGGVAPRRAVPAGDGGRPTAVIREPGGTTPTGIQAPSRQPAGGIEVIRPPSARRNGPASGLPEGSGEEPGRPVLERRPTGEGVNQGVRPGIGPTVRGTGPATRDGGRPGSGSPPPGEARPPDGDRPPTAGPRRPSSAVPRGGTSSSGSGDTPRPSAPSTRPTPTRRPPPSRPPGSTLSTEGQGGGFGEGVPIGDLGRPAPRGVPLGDLDRGSVAGGASARSGAPDGAAGARPRETPSGDARPSRGAETEPTRDAGAGRSRIRAIAEGVFERARGSSVRAVDPERAGPPDARPPDRGVAVSPGGNPSRGVVRTPAARPPETPAGATSTDRRAAPRAEPATDRRRDPPAASGGQAPSRAAPSRAGGASRSDPPAVRRTPGGARRPPPPPGR